MSNTKRFALVFPGQGSQAIGMLKALATAYPIVGETFTEANDVLGFDLWGIIQNGAEEDLNRTTVTQPALLAADIACYRAWRAQGGPTPDWVAGHSLGEYAALVCADALRFSDALTLVALRGRLMQEAVPEGAGAMAAILGLPDQAVEALCRDVADGEVLAAVNYNAPGQVVIAGTKAAVLRAIAGAKAAGAKRAIPLAVSVPSHCALMRPAAARLGPELAPIAFQSPVIPVLHNWNVDWAIEPDQIRTALVNQLSSPVRWVETMQRMAVLGATSVLECGPGKVLTGLNKRIVDVPCLAIGEPADLSVAVATMRTLA
ncbi:MAG: ACP S-malonyltransferase [Acidiferrobacter sp.]